MVAWIGRADHRRYARTHVVQNIRCILTISVVNRAGNPLEQSRCVQDVAERLFILVAPVKITEQTKFADKLQRTARRGRYVRQTAPETGPLQRPIEPERASAATDNVVPPAAFLLRILTS